MACPSNLVLPPEATPPVIQTAYAPTQNVPHRKVTLVYEGRRTTQDIEIECEVYGQQPPYIVHSLCPVCRNSITIKGTDKRIELDDVGLHIERFTCPWELTPGQGFGLGLCRFSCVYDGREIKDV